MEQADAAATRIEAYRGRLAELTATELAAVMGDMADLNDALGRAGSYAGLRFSVDTSDPERGAAMQRFQEQATAISTRILFLELEWAEVDDARAAELLASPELDFCRYYLESARRYRPHLLTEPEEKILSEKYVTGSSAWSRLFDELTSAIVVDLPDGPDEPRAGPLPPRLARPQRAPGRGRGRHRRASRPGLRTRAFVFNTLHGRQGHRRPPALATTRGSPAATSPTRPATSRCRPSSTPSSAATTSPSAGTASRPRCSALERIADYDRKASVADVEEEFSWSQATEIVLDAYGSFSDELAGVVRTFIDESWIDAPVRPGKRPGAFCSYTVPSAHPFLLLNWTSRRRDVLTLAHELGHGLHAYLARQQGIFHQTTPLTLAETASVFGETVTFGRLLSDTTDPGGPAGAAGREPRGPDRHGVPPGGDEPLRGRRAHPPARASASCRSTTSATRGSAPRRRCSATPSSSPPATARGGATSRTSSARPGYVYAYAYGQLLALAVYARYEAEGASFVPAYLDLLRAGGSMEPEALGRIVGVDLADPGFWDGGLAIIDEQLSAAEAAAKEAGRL